MENNHNSASARERGWHWWRDGATLLCYIKCGVGGAGSVWRSEGICGGGLHNVLS